MQLCTLTTPAHAGRVTWGPGSSLLRLARPLSEARREASARGYRVARAAHTCAVSQRARRGGALTTLALRNVVPAGPTQACGSCSLGVLGSGRVSSLGSSLGGC